MNTLANPSDLLLPVGVDHLHETPVMPESAYNLGGLACLASYENGSMDADATGTTESIDPDTMDPYTFDISTDFIPSSVVNLN